MKHTGHKQPQTFKRILLLLVTLGLLGGILYLVDGHFPKEQKQTKTKPDTKEEKTTTTQEQQVLDCAKKLEQKDALSQDTTDQELNDCLFMGCGNFFQ